MRVRSLGRVTAAMATAALVLFAVAGYGHFDGGALRAAGSVSYGPGWNLVSGPNGSRLHGATGLLYTLQPGDTGYETFPVTAPLRDGIGYYAYFPSGGSVDLASGARYYAIRLPQRQWILVGNPSDTQPATFSGDIESAQVASIAPGHGTFVLASGLIVVSAPEPVIAPTPSPTPLPPVATPLPPCVDGAYPPGTAGNGCRPTTQTRPTARCFDGSFDYSRSTLSCAGRGGVAYWLPVLPGEEVPPPMQGPACVPNLPPEGNGTGPTLCADGTCSPSAGSGACSDHGGIAGAHAKSTRALRRYTM